MKTLVTAYYECLSESINYLLTK